MRIEEILHPIPEESNPIFKITFKNDLGQVAAPSSIYWDLLTLDGTVLAVDQVVPVVGEVSYVQLTTTQTELLTGEVGSAERIMAFKAWYHSEALGETLITRKQIKITIEDFMLVGIEDEDEDDYPDDLDIDTYDTAQVVDL